MEWEITKIVDDALKTNSAYDAEEYVKQAFDCDHALRMKALALLRQHYKVIVTPTSNPPKVAKKAAPKVSIRPDRELYEADWEMVIKADPALVMQMLRLRFRWSNMTPPTAWFRDNCKGLYHFPGGNCVLFELEEDAVLFKMSFEGSL